MLSKVLAEFERRGSKRAADPRFCERGKKTQVRARARTLAGDSQGRGGYLEGPRTSNDDDSGSQASCNTSHGQRRVSEKFPGRSAWLKRKEADSERGKKTGVSLTAGPQ